MNQRPVVADSSPLIALERVEHLHLLPALFERVMIPFAVKREVFADRPLPEWVEAVAITQTVSTRLAAMRLGPGEREAIALAVELNAAELLLDDLAARRLAISLEIPVIGTLGLLLRAKRRGLIPQIKLLLDALQQSGFRVSERVREGILSAAAELE